MCPECVFINTKLRGMLHSQTCVHNAQQLSLTNDNFCPTTYDDHQSRAAQLYCTLGVGGRHLRVCQPAT